MHARPLTRSPAPRYRYKGCLSRNSDNTKVSSIFVRDTRRDWIASWRFPLKFDFDSVVNTYYESCSPSFNIFPRAVSRKGIERFEARNLFIRRSLINGSRKMINDKLLRISAKVTLKRKSEDFETRNGSNFSCPTIANFFLCFFLFSFFLYASLFLVRSS